jgi:hypothetical protein
MEPEAPTEPRGTVAENRLDQVGQAPRAILGAAVSKTTKRARWQARTEATAPLLILLPLGEWMPRLISTAISVFLIDPCDDSVPVIGSGRGI